MEEGGKGTRRTRKREGRRVGGNDAWKMRMRRVEKNTQEDHKK